MKENEFPPEDFSVSEDGPLYKLAKKIPYVNTYKRAAVFGLCITWLPLVIICAFEGTLYSGVQIPFLFDVAMQARVLIAFPMMILIKDAIDNNAKNVLKFMGNELLDVEDRQVLINTAFRKARKLSSSFMTEIIILILIITSTVSMVYGGVYSGLESGTTSWMAKTIEGTQQFSIAGYWSVCFCIPLIHFFIIRWVWRYIVWVLLLFRFSKANIKLLPTHADKAGGLGILMIAQRSFSLFFVAMSIIVSGELTSILLKHPETFEAIRSETIGYIIICLLILISPVAVFSTKLFKVKNEGLLRLGNLASDLSRKFEREWVNDKPIEKTLDDQQVDPSLLYDYAGMYSAVQEMRIIPVTISDIITMAGMLFVPFIPIVFIHFPVVELLQKITGVLL